MTPALQIYRKLSIRTLLHPVSSNHDKFYAINEHQKWHHKAENVILLSLSVNDIHI